MKKGQGIIDHMHIIKIAYGLIKLENQIDGKVITGALFWLNEHGFCTQSV